MSGSCIRQRRTAIVFENDGILQKGHFVLSSGLHTGKYVNSDRLLSTPYVMERFFLDKLVTEVCHRYQERAGTAVDAVTGPPLGGTILSFLASIEIRRGYMKFVVPLFIDKDGKNLRLRTESRAQVSGKRVIIFDDVMTTGRQVKEVIIQIRENGGIPVAAAVICNRGNVRKKDIGIPIISFWSPRYGMYLPENCPLCKRGVPINVDMGHAEDFAPKNR